MCKILDAVNIIYNLKLQNVCNVSIGLLDLNVCLYVKFSASL